MLTHPECRRSLRTQQLCVTRLYRLALDGEAQSYSDSAVGATALARTVMPQSFQRGAHEIL
jgi:hypothetical protein